MRPDLLLAALALWLVLALLVPKRSWREIPSRIRAVVEGERRHLYGPWRVSSVLPRPVGRLWRALIGAMEAGAVVYLVGLVAERFGGPRRLERELRWADSAAGLLWRLAEGELGRAEVDRRLVVMGQPPLRDEIVLQPEVPVQRAPLAWTQEWDDMQRDGGQRVEEEPAPLPAAAPFRPASSGGGLRIHTLGGLTIYRGDEDLAPSLMHRPSLAFLVVHLLAHAVVDPGANQFRASIAEEQSPRLGSSEARARLRGKLRDISGFLDPDIARLVYADPEYVRFDLAGCSVDVMRLRALAAEAQTAGPVLPPDLLAEAKSALDDGPGEFLPEWGALEKDASASGGAAEVVVQSARECAERARVDLLIAVADAYLALRNPTAAVPYLEEANSRRPDLEPVAARFVDALRWSGQPARAEQVEASYGFARGSGGRDGVRSRQSAPGV